MAGLSGLRRRRQRGRRFATIARPSTSALSDVPSPTAPATRGRDIHEAHRSATPLELLFDLSFVVAVALAAAQLHHAEGADQALATLPGYALAFFAIWWGWMNYTWFGSAYDNDDAIYRVLTLLQMGGALVFAVGVPALFEGRVQLAVAGYALMRMPLCVQWLRAPRGEPPRRGPRPRAAPDIAERYSGFVIIILGESILGAANAIAGVVQAHGLSADVVLVGLGGTLLAFCLWWMYFLLPSGDALHRHRERSFGWGYGHYLAFAALAAVGSGLQVVADRLKPHDAAAQADAALGAINAVAVPLALFVLAIWALHGYVTRAQARQWPLTLVVLACIGLGPLAVDQGLPLAWGLLLLSLGPIVAIAYQEHGRAHCATQFAPR